MYDDINAVNALNEYVRKLLNVNLGWEPVNGVFPLVPLAQQPELLATGKPFIVYGWARHPVGHLYQHRRDSISYTVFAPDGGNEAGSDIVERVINLLSDTFDRQDEAADDVNDYLEQVKTEAGRDRKIGFTSIRTTVVENAQAAEEEGGIVAGLIMVDAQYVKLGETAITKLEYTP